MTRFWVGGYGADMAGGAEGIGVLATDAGGGPSTLRFRGVAARVASASWLAAHPALDVAYAALEGEGTVQAFARDGEASLRPLGAPLHAGPGVCHLAVSPGGRMLVASCYGDGRVVAFGIAGDGSLVPAAADRAAALRAALFGELREPGSVPGADTPDVGPDAADRPTSGVSAPDPYAARDPYPTPAGEEPRASHAHQAVFLPDRRIATTDTGFDLVRIWRPSTGSGTQARSGTQAGSGTRAGSGTQAGSGAQAGSGTPEGSGIGPGGLVLDHEVVLPRGTGPRHMLLHPSGHLHVVTEYSCEIFTLACARDGRWGLRAAVAASPIAQVGADFAGELAVSRDGDSLYTALRGSNTLAALRVRGGGDVLEPLALADSGVDWPRHHLVYQGTLLVAGQRSNTVSAVDIDERTGAPRDVRHVTPAPTPTVILHTR